jgi:hypothetical protein
MGQRTLAFTKQMLSVFYLVELKELDHLVAEARSSIPRSSGNESRSHNDEHQWEHGRRHMELRRSTRRELRTGRQGPTATPLRWAGSRAAHGAAAARAGSGRRATLAESRWLRATGRWPPTARASRACCRAR